MMLAIICNLAIYSLFSTSYRFSRGVILFGGIFASLLILLFRYLLLKTGMIESVAEEREHRQTLICGDQDSYEQVVKLMQQAGRNERILGRVGIEEGEKNVIGIFSKLNSLVKAIPAREIVF